jgi:cytochrome b561
VAAALKHLLARDGVFQRMWPRRAQREMGAPAASHSTLRGA